MLFAIYAYENMYGGLHGICDYDIIETKSQREAESHAVEMSLDVMDSYQDVYESFEQDAEYEGLVEDSEEWEEYISECRADNIAYDIWIITNTKGKSNEELQEEFYNNKEEFIRKYCERV